MKNVLRMARRLVLCVGAIRTCHSLMSLTSGCGLRQLARLLSGSEGLPYTISLSCEIGAAIRSVAYPNR